MTETILLINDGPWGPAALPAIEAEARRDALLALYAAVEGLPKPLFVSSWYVDRAAVLVLIEAALGEPGDD